MKKVVQERLMKLQDQLNAFEWRARQQTRAAVKSTIRFTLNELPEQPYPMLFGLLYSRDNKGLLRVTEDQDWTLNFAAR